MYHPSSSSPVDQCLLSQEWRTATELENMSADDKRNQIIIRLEEAGQGTMSELQAKSNQQLVDVCTLSLAGDTQLPPNRRCPPTPHSPLAPGAWGVGK